MTRFAYVLGANGPESFGRLKRLTFAETDAQEMATRLRLDDLGFKIAALEPRRPMARTVIEQFDEVASGAEDQDELLFYFAGHGIISHGELFFILNDTMRGRLAGTALPWHTVKQIIRHSAAAAKVVVLDCCHAGEAVDDPLGGAFRGGFDTEAINSAIKGSSASIMVACGPDGFARESSKVGGGVLTGLILQALGPRRPEAIDGSGRVSLESLRNWIWNEIDRSDVLAPVRKDRPRLYSAGGPTFYLDLASPSSVSNAPPSLPQRPNNIVTNELGIQLLQGGQTVLIDREPDDVQVARLARSPFVILMPRSMTPTIDAGELALQITASDDAALLDIARETTASARVEAVRQRVSKDYSPDMILDPLFTLGTGLAEYNYGSGFLCATRINDLPWSHNFIVQGRFNVDQDGRRGLYVSSLMVTYAEADQGVNLLADANEIYVVWRTFRIGDYSTGSPGEPLTFERIRLKFDATTNVEPDVSRKGLEDPAQTAVPSLDAAGVEHYRQWMSERNKGMQKVFDAICHLTDEKLKPVPTKKIGEFLGMSVDTVRDLCLSLSADGLVTLDVKKSGQRASPFLRPYRAWKEKTMKAQ